MSVTWMLTTKGTALCGMVQAAVGLSAVSVMLMGSSMTPSSKSKGFHSQSEVLLSLRL